MPISPPLPFPLPVGTQGKGKDDGEIMEYFFYDRHLDTKDNGDNQLWTDDTKHKKYC